MYPRACASWRRRAGSRAPGEHPDRRTRRFYSITEAGREEYERLRAELGPFLEGMIRTVSLIQREIYGEESG